MIKQFLKFLFTGSLLRVLLVVAMLVAMLFGLTPLVTLDNALYDQLLRLRPAGSSGRVAVVAIDEASIRQVGSWPWPRTYLAELLSLLSQQEPAAIGLHLMLPGKEWNPALVEIDRLRRELDLTSNHALIAQSLIELEASLDGDSQLRRAISVSGRVVVPFQLLSEPAALTDSNLNLPSGYYWSSAEPNWQESLAALHNPFRNWLKPEVAKGLLSGFFSPEITPLHQGHINYSSDSTGRVRQLSLLKPFKDRLYPAFALHLAALADVANKPVIKEDNGSLFVNGTHLSTGDDFAIYTDPALEQTIVQYSFSEVVSGKLAEGTFRNKVVLVGLTESANTAGGTVTVSKPAAVISAAALVSSLLNKTQVVRPYWAFLLEAAILLYLGIFLTLVLPRLHLALGWLLQLFFLVSWVGTVTGLLVLRGMWFQLAPHLVLVVVGLLLVTLQRYLSRNGQNFEDLKLLGLSFQSQGMLDMAFEKFSQCPISDQSVKEILYNLGLDFERKRMFNKASAVYSHLLKGGKFKDAKKKIADLQEMEKTVVLGGGGSKDGTMILGKGATTPTLGRYEVIRELGQGAMGVVYLGRDPKINREVAIKTLNMQEVDPAQAKDVLERFFREAEAAGRLNHPHIVTIYDAGEEHDLAYMAMEYLVGKDLSAHCNQKSLLPVSEVLRISAEVAEALAYAHKNEVVHRDIKPSNLMLLKSGQVKVTDFGIARVVDSSQTQTGTILGTPSYMSPEQVSGEKVKGRSDLFSLGVVCYELLSGHKPFVGDNLGALMHNIANVKYTPLKKVNPDLPECCYPLVRKLLKKEFKDRYKNATEVADALRLCIKKIG